MFKQSLFKELGTNTGKWVSNKVFGDNWSTPYRFSNSGTVMARKALKIEKEIHTLKRKRFFEKYGMTVFAVLFFAVIIYLNFLLGHFDDF